MENDTYDILEKMPKPITSMKELKSRLKHIAVLCIGLSIDIGEEIRSSAKLKKELAELRLELEVERAIPKKRPRKPVSAETKEKHRRHAIEQWARKKMERENPKAEH